MGAKAAKFLTGENVGAIEVERNSQLGCPGKNVSELILLLTKIIV